MGLVSRDSRNSTTTLDHDDLRHKPYLAAHLTILRNRPLQSVSSQLRCFVSETLLSSTAFSNITDNKQKSSLVWASISAMYQTRTSPNSSRFVPSQHRQLGNRISTDFDLNLVPLGYHSRLQPVFDFQQAFNYLSVQARLRCRYCAEDMLFLPNLPRHLWLLGILRLCLHVCSGCVLLGRG
jgi:hypothetical protein